MNPDETPFGMPELEETEPGWEVHMISLHQLLIAALVALTIVVILWVLGVIPGP